MDPVDCAHGLVIGKCRNIDTHVDKHLNPEHFLIGFSDCIVSKCNEVLVEQTLIGSSRKHSLFAFQSLDTLLPYTKTCHSTTEGTASSLQGPRSCH